MSAAEAAIADFARQIAALSGEVARPVCVDVARVADRRGSLVLKPPGLWSPNRSCRMVRGADGWIAVNLPRETDRELVPAWLGVDSGADPWPAILAEARLRPWRRLVDDARLLGLPVCGVGEVVAGSPEAPARRMAEPNGRRRSGPLRVIDLSAMWAGPLCGALLAGAGAEVIKVESRARPDALREASPAFFDRLNGGKRQIEIDFDAAGLTALADEIAAADVLITSARPRAFEQLGLTPERLFARNPGLTWVVISGYGWLGEDADRVAFGDDAAAAGGLVRWIGRGEPRFTGDALADPLTGLAAAAGAFRAIRDGGGWLVDAALARTAAGVAAARP